MEKQALLSCPNLRDQSQLLTLKEAIHHCHSPVGFVKGVFAAPVWGVEGWFCHLDRPSTQPTASIIMVTPESAVNKDSSTFINRVTDTLE